MARRSSSKLAGDLAEYEKRALELQVEGDRIAVAHGQADELRDQAADAELANDLAAAARFRADASKLDLAAGNREKELASLVPRLEALIASTKDELERARFEEMLDARDAKAASAAKLARGIASNLKQPLADASKLAELRAEVDALDSQARELAKPLGAEVQAFEDEPTFGDQAALDFLQAGARQLNAATKAEAERQAASWAKERPQLIERTVRTELTTMIPLVHNGQPRLGPIEHLPEGLRSDALEAYAKAVKRLPEHVRATQERRLALLRERMKASKGPGEDERESDSGAGAELGRDPLAPIAA